ncbi:MAG TPA: hypothetical protein VIN10_09345, partial [Bacteroidales bacterium]
MAEGKMLIKYTSGIAILTLPFFLLAHFLAPLFGFPADGLSMPYQLSMTVGGLIYTFIGLFYFKKILEHFFEKNIALLVLLLVFFGTNYLQIVAFDGTLLAHNFLFTFYAILIYYTIKWEENQSAFSAKMIALSFGFISLMRPTEAVSILIPLLYNVYDWKSLKAKIQLVRKNIQQLKMVIFIVFIIWLPQILYWKMVSGHYFFYSYQNAGEGLDFLSPHTMNFLFSFRKGWLVYTPLMVFSIIGFVFLFKKNRPLFYALFIFTVVNIYVISSWTCWWYAGGSFSARAIIPAYTVLAFPLGYFLIWVKQKGKVFTSIISVIILLLVVLNLFQTWQFENGIFSKERMTREYYAAIFGKTSVPPEAEKLLLVNRIEKGAGVFSNIADYTMKSLYSSSGQILNSTNYQLVKKENVYTTSVDYRFKQQLGSRREAVYVKARIKSETAKEGQLFYLVLTMHHGEEAYNYRVEKIYLPKGEWVDVSFEYEQPETKSDEDVLKIYWWNKDGIDEVEVADFVVEVGEKFVLDEKYVFTESIEYSFDELTSKDHAWIRIKAKVKSDWVNENQLLYLVASFHHKGVPYAYKAHEIQLPKGEWIDVQLDYLTPEVRKKEDLLKVYFWNKDGIKNVEVTDFVVEAYEKKE